jgi:hypothetical protein
MKRSLTCFALFSVIYGQLAFSYDQKVDRVKSVYTWYDGQKLRKAMIVPDMIAEFGGLDLKNLRLAPALTSPLTPKKSLQLNEVFPDVQFYAEKNSVKLWKVPRKFKVASLNKKSQKLHLSSGAHYSPLFREGEQGEGRMSALPGNVIVIFYSNWSTEKIKKWAFQHHLVMLKNLENSSQIWMVQSPPGLESLQLANQLYETGEVLASIPNWWKESAKR